MMAATMCSEIIVLPTLATDEEKAANVWMAITESACHSAKCLDILLGTMPALTNPEGPAPADNDVNSRTWFRERNDFLVQTEVRSIRSNRLVTELTRKLSGAAFGHARIAPGVLPHVIWNNLKEGLQKTISRSSEYAGNVYRSTHISQYASLPLYLDDLTKRCSNLGEVRATLHEQDKIMVLFNGLKGTKWESHRLKHIQSTDNATVEMYIKYLRKDYALQNQFVGKDYGNVLGNVDKNFKKNYNNKNNNINNNSNSVPNSNNSKNKQLSGSVPSVSVSNHNDDLNNHYSKKFPDRKRDLTGIDKERQKGRYKSNKIICTYCKRVGHLVGDCRKKIRDMSGEKGNFLGEDNSRSDSDDTASNDYPYRYDETEQDICLKLRGDHGKYISNIYFKNFNKNIFFFFETTFGTL
jgi:hypothetical protein